MPDDPQIAGGFDGNQVTDNGDPRSASIAGRFGAYFRRPATRRAVIVVGRVVTIIAVLFVAYQVWLQLAALGEFLQPSFLIGLLAAAIAYGGCAALLAIAWNQTLMMSGHRLSLEDAVSIYGRSHVLKYLPSNVLHLVGRYAMLRDRDVEHRTILSSTAAEIGLSVAVAVSIAAVLGGTVLVENLDIAGLSEGMMTAAIVAVVLITCGAVWALVVLGSRGRFRLLGDGGPRAVATIATYVVYFLLFGGVTAVIAVAGGVSVDGNSYLALVGIAAAAWVVGLVTPGAPAGFGVREAVMIVALEETSFADEALLIALGLRVATLAGDALLWAVAVLVERRQPRA
ncbi:hypothetical protein [Bauldia sp.]|uniref:hypothetical protein n=1 Tax=Bauldia sp. TaxID=2575872 RepID=UPI003BACD087